LAYVLNCFVRPCGRIGGEGEHARLNVFSSCPGQQLFVDRLGFRWLSGIGQTYGQSCRGYRMAAGHRHGRLAGGNSFLEPAA
jgi:hypothetical protein